jgi:hypothetical protein
MMDFSCLQKEDNTYCISIAMNTVPSPNTLNFDGSLVTKPICKEPEDTSDTDTGGDSENDVDIKCIEAEGRCGPWCKHSSYDCLANIGRCDDFLNCNTATGTFAPQTCTCTSKVGQLVSYAGCCVAAVVKFNCDSLKSGAATYDSTVDVSQCDQDNQASIAKGYPMSKAMVRAESCGFTLDPRCTHGKAVSTIAFPLTFANVAECDESTFKPSLQAELAKVLGAAPDDIFVDEPCSVSGGRRLADSNTLQPVVTIEESGVTSLEMVKSIKQTMVASGKLDRAIESAKGLTAVSGKNIVLTDVGAESTSTKTGVRGSTALQVKAKALEAQSTVTSAPTVDQNAVSQSSRAETWTFGSVFAIFAVAHMC